VLGSFALAGRGACAQRGSSIAIGIAAADGSQPARRASRTRRRDHALDRHDTYFASLPAEAAGRSAVLAERDRGHMATAGAAADHLGVDAGNQGLRGVGGAGLLPQAAAVHAVGIAAAHVHQQPARCARRRDLAQTR